MAGKHSDHYFRRWQANIVTTINFFLEKNEKNEKCLELPDLARKCIRIFFLKKNQKVLRIAGFGEKIDQNIFFENFTSPPGFLRFF